MKLAYLMNSYPMTSTTFVRREIAAIEEAGAPVVRYAIRQWDGALVDARDIAERDRTTYILQGNAAGLVVATLAALVRTPLRFARAAGLAARLQRRAGEGVVRHAAYLMEGAWLAARARADGVGHIHAHFATNAAAVAMISHALGGPGYSFTTHGPDELVEPERLSYDLKIANARHVAAISRYCRGRLTALSDPAHHDRIEIVRCGVFLDEFAMTPPDPASRAILCVGRLCPQKGQHHLPAAFAKTLADHPDATLLLVGDGEDRAKIEAEIARLGVGQAITLLGWRDNAEVAALIRRSRALILPSYAEGLPVVIMEALAMGRPAISTRIAGIPELLDAECGWIVEPGDVEGFARAMSQALSADEARLAAMGRVGRTRVEAMHDQRRNAVSLARLVGALD